MAGLARYSVRRLLYVIPVFIGVSILSFLVMYAAGDPIRIMLIGKPNVTKETIEALKAYYGLDKPIPLQYLNWLWNLLHGNLGRSLYAARPVNQIIGSWFIETVKLQLVSIALALVISIFIGVLSAKRQYSKLDLTVTSTALFGVSMPTFWFGIILIIVFSFNLGWLPSSGAYGDPVKWWGNPVLDAVAHIILPAVVLTYVSLAQNIRLIRANMLEVLRQDYILAAKASGLPERSITYRHALRNAISPVVTYLGLSLGGIIGGAPITETVFGWPGLGRRFVEAAIGLDFPVVMGITMIITVMTLVANLITDFSYAALDPRVRIE